MAGVAVTVAEADEVVDAVVAAHSPIQPFHFHEHEPFVQMKSEMSDLAHLLPRQSGKEGIRPSLSPQTC